MKTQLKAMVMALFLVPGSITVNAQWTLAWSDEFNYTGLPDNTKWCFESGPNWPNGELQYYTNERTENCRVNGNYLIIEARKENYGGKNYTSARINSKQSFTYGKMEFSARLTKGNALWPAIWMLPDDIFTGAPWPNCGEIDIMEYWSWAPNSIYGTIHTEAYNHIIHTEKQGYVNVSNPANNFHKFSIIWGPERIDWFVNDTWFFGFANEGTVQTWPFDKNFHFVLNVAVEGWMDNDPNNYSTWEKTFMEVDWVRVYQWSNTPVGSTIGIKGSNNKFVSSNNGATAITCDRTTVGGWEQFTVVDAGNGKVALRGSNGKYISSNNGQTPMFCDRNSFEGWEVFEWVNLDGGLFALKGNNGMYVSSENGTQGMYCNRSGIGDWEKFNYVFVSQSLPTSVLFETNPAIKIYPQPAINTLNISGLKTQTTNILIYDLTGKKIQSLNNNSAENVEINITNYKPGAYIIKTISSNQINSEIFIKK